MIKELRNSLGPIRIEGLYIDENVTFADLKQAILLFAREMFGPETQIRMRPGVWRCGHGYAIGWDFFSR